MSVHCQCQLCAGVRQRDDQQCTGSMLRGPCTVRVPVRAWLRVPCYQRKVAAVPTHWHWPSVLSTVATEPLLVLALKQTETPSNLYLCHMPVHSCFKWTIVDAFGRSMRLPFICTCAQTHKHTRAFEATDAFQPSFQHAQWFADHWWRVFRFRFRGAADICCNVLHSAYSHSDTVYTDRQPRPARDLYRYQYIQYSIQS